MISPNDFPLLLLTCPISAPNTWPFSAAKVLASFPNFSALCCMPFISSITEFLMLFMSTFSPFISNFSAVEVASGITNHNMM